MAYLDIHSVRWIITDQMDLPVLILKTEGGDKHGLQVIMAEGSSTSVSSRDIQKMLDSARLDDPAVAWLYQKAVAALAKGQFVPRDLSEFELYQAFAERIHF